MGGRGPNIDERFERQPIERLDPSYERGRSEQRDGGEITCRTVVVPGSGRDPQEVCERTVQQCRTVVVPGSGRGPHEVCEPVVQTCRTTVIPGSGRGPQQICE